MHVDNHEIAGDSLEPPVVVRAQKLAHARHADGAFDCRQKNRPIARYAQRPQRLLAEAVLLDSALRRSESRMREHQVSRQILVQRCIGWRDSQIAQLRLCLRPRKIERPPGAVGIVVQIGELDRALFLLGDECRESHVCRASGRNANADPQRENRIQHCAHRSTQLRALVQRRRVSHRAATPDEFRPIGFAGDCANRFRAGRNNVRTPE